jgi:hypothetical protein
MASGAQIAMMAAIQIRLYAAGCSSGQGGSAPKSPWGLPNSSRRASDHRIPAGGGWDGLRAPDVYALFRRFLRTWHESPSLQARHRLSNERLADALRATLAGEVGLPEHDDRVRVMAAMLLGVIGLRYETAAAAVLAEVPADEVERRVRAVVGEGMARVARAFPDLDRP